MKRNTFSSYVKSSLYTRWCLILNNLMSTGFYLNISCFQYRNLKLTETSILCKSKIHNRKSYYLFSFLVFLSILKLNF